jgi:hypothetical protein
MITNGHVIRCAKRTGFITEDEVFHNHHLVLEQHRDKVLKVFADLKARFPDITECVVFGELFGGM